MMNTITEAFESVVSKIGSPSKNGTSAHRILCVGLCTMDIVQSIPSYLREDTDYRLRSAEMRWERGGNPSNNCTVLSQLGADCEYFGAFAKDSHLNFLLENLKKYNINIEHCVYHSDCDTPLSTVIIALDSGTRTIIHSNPSLPELTIDDFKQLPLKKYAWIHFEGRNISEVQKMMEYVEYWNESNAKNEAFTPIKMSLDLENENMDLLDLLPYVDVIFVGKDFARALKCNNMSETLKCLSKDIKEGATIICAWGDHGAMARGPDGTTVQSPAYSPRKVVDTLGAGDTFCASVIFYLSSGRSLKDSITFGCQIAGGKVGHRGFQSIASIFDKICLDN